jgi:hypothetical protein
MGTEGMYAFAADLPIDVEAIRARFRRMTDDQLLRYGRACRYMCSRWANFGKPPRAEAVVQLNEARAEWKRRHPRKGDTSLP